MSPTLSREIFREYDIRGVTGKDLTPEVARLVARAYAAFLVEKKVAGAIAVGRDNRPSGVRSASGDRGRAAGERIRCSGHWRRSDTARVLGAAQAGRRGRNSDYRLAQSARVQWIQARDGDALDLRRGHPAHLRDRRGGEFSCSGERDGTAATKTSSIRTSMISWLSVSDSFPTNLNCRCRLRKWRGRACREPSSSIEARARGALSFLRERRHVSRTIIPIRRFRKTSAT